jgi:hypothetical protein
VSLALAAYVAAIRAAVGDVVDEALVTTLAGYAWDSWASASKYISRDDFIAYVLDALAMEPAKAAEKLRELFGVEFVQAIAKHVRG